MRTAPPSLCGCWGTIYMCGFTRADATAQNKFNRNTSLVLSPCNLRPSVVPGPKTVHLGGPWEWEEAVKEKQIQEECNPANVQGSTFPVFAGPKSGRCG